MNKLFVALTVAGSAPRRMKRRIALSCLGFFLILNQSIIAQEPSPPARSVSPDGKWEFRAGAASEQGDFVIAKSGSIETSPMLSEEEYADGLAEKLRSQRRNGKRTRIFFLHAQIRCCG